MEEAKVLYGIILTFWKLIKKWTDNPATDEESWLELIDEAETLRREHKEDEALDVFCKGLIFSWFDYLLIKQRQDREK